MQLKEEVGVTLSLMLLIFYCLLFQYRTSESLRREHDAQIIKIAMEAGLRITPETWSTQLYGNTNRKSEMQSIIDKVR